MFTPVIDRVAPAVSINGNYMGNVLSADIASTSSFSADTFSVTLAIGSGPLDSTAFWSSVSEAYVEIFSSDMTVCFVTGMADMVLIDPLQGIAKVEGRDLSSRLIEASPEQDFVNQTAAEIVTSVASKHGLLPTIVPTTGMTGRFYGDNFTRLAIGKFTNVRSEWDLVVELARECQYDVYVNGQTLYFEPTAALTGTPLILTLDILSSLRIERALWISASPAVQMSTWSSQDLAVYSQTEGATASTSAYCFSGSNLTSSQVGQYSARYLNEITRMSQIVSAEMPWTDSINTRTPVYLYGVGGTLDGAYRVDHIDRQFRTSTGSRQRLVLSRSNA